MIIISELEKTLFDRASSEKYWLFVKKDGDYDHEEIATQQERFRSVWKVIEEAGLADKYEQYENEYKKSLSK